MKKEKTMSLGGYKWEAHLRNGLILSQYEEGQEVSFDTVRDLDVAMLVLFPQTDTFRLIRVDVHHDERVTKHWTRTIAVQGGLYESIAVVDVIGVQGPHGSRWLHIYPDGTIAWTWNKEV
jgi:hypothetical protein